jgi:hypothetical protein
MDRLGRLLPAMGSVLIDFLNETRPRVTHSHRQRWSKTSGNAGLEGRAGQSTTASRRHMRVGARADEPHFPRHRQARAISPAASCETARRRAIETAPEPRGQSAKHYARRASDAPCRIRFAPTAASPLSPLWPLL